MFDSAWHYNKGASDEDYGIALTPSQRQKVYLMSKAHKYSRGEAMSQLEDTLRRMKTDYLDVWQVHQVVTQKEVDQILGPDGSLEAFVQAKKQGKVRHIGFTGHADPAVHQRSARQLRRMGNRAASGKPDRSALPQLSSTPSCRTFVRRGSAYLR
jgi:uncharacterized protein